MRVARSVILSPDQREILESRARAGGVKRGAERARIVLLAAAGLQDKQIAAQLRIMPATAARWRNRFLDSGLAALDKDAPRSGRRPSITLVKVQEVIRRTTQERPSSAANWSTRRMAKATGLSENSVRRIWHQYGIKPHLAPMFEVSNNPTHRG
jgi:transposase